MLNVSRIRDAYESACYEHIEPSLECPRCITHVLLYAYDGKLEQLEECESARESYPPCE